MFKALYCLEAIVANMRRYLYIFLVIVVMQRPWEYYGVASSSHIGHKYLAGCWWVLIGLYVAQTWRWRVGGGKYRLAGEDLLICVLQGFSLAAVSGPKAPLEKSVVGVTLALLAICLIWFSERPISLSDREWEAKRSDKPGQPLRECVMSCDFSDKPE